MARFPFLADAPAIGHASESSIDASRLGLPRRADSALSLRAAARTVRLHHRLVLSVILSALLAGLLYCLIAPPQYESRARLALREFGIGSDRGRIVREALSYTLADLDANGQASILADRLGRRR